MRQCSSICIVCMYLYICGQYYPHIYVWPPSLSSVFVTLSAKIVMPNMKRARSYRKRSMAQPQTIVFKGSRTLIAGQNTFSVNQICGANQLGVLTSRPNKISKIIVRAAAAVPTPFTMVANSSLGTSTTERIATTADRVAGTSEMVLVLRVPKSQDYSQWLATDNVFEVFAGGPLAFTFTLVMHVRAQSGLNAI